MLNLIKAKLGFTIIELLVTVAIMAILAAIGLTTYHGLEMKAKEAKVLSDFQDMAKDIEIARQANNTTFCGLTGNSACCSDCWCAGYAIQTSSCTDVLQTSWSHVTSEPLPKDPWGDYYTFDENEGENYNDPVTGKTLTCRWDILKSAGPDKIRGCNGYTTGPWCIAGSGDDDYIYFVRPFQCTTKDPEETTPGKVMGGKAGAS